MYRQSQGTRNYGKLSSHAILVKSCENHAFAKEITKYLIDLTKKNFGEGNFSLFHTVI